MMNCCGYDYVTLGNHDFNYGMPYLESYLNALRARCVCQNIRWDGAGVRFPACIHTLENGLRIGIVGIVTDYVNIWERPEHLSGITISDPIPAAAAALEELRGKTDLNLCVYHGGFERDLTTGRVLSSTHENVAYRICQELDFDILLTGHQHMLDPRADSLRHLCGAALRPRPGIFADRGRRLRYGKAAFQPHHPRRRSLPSPVAAAVCSDGTWRAGLVGSGGRSPAPPAAAGCSPKMAAEGSGLADLFNAVQLEVSGAQLSAASLANDVAGLPQVVRRRDLLIAYPYTNTLTVLRITGAVLRQAMERSAAYFTRGEDNTLRVSDCFLEPKVEHYNYDYYAGVSYAYDISRPVGQRVVSLLVDGHPVADTDEFTICLNSYRASGTGGYGCYVGCPVVREIPTKCPSCCWNIFADTAGISPLPPAITESVKMKSPRFISRGLALSKASQYCAKMKQYKGSQPSGRELLFFSLSVSAT